MNKERLYRHALQKLVDEFKDEFPMIVLDAVKVLEADVSDICVGDIQAPRLTMTEFKKMAFGKVHALAFVKWCDLNKFVIHCLPDHRWMVTLAGFDTHLTPEVVYDKFLAEEMANFHNK